MNTFKKSALKIAMTSALFSGVSFTASAAEENPSVQEIERVEVTGSRIRSAEALSSSPIQVLSGEDIQKSGVINLQDLLLENPAFGSPAISRTNSNFSTSGGGLATVDLRNLGTNRTLVLVNGRRHVAGRAGSTDVDLNVIPTQFIERVEVLTGGASSVYGSDAVAGVVNFVLKKEYEGIEFDGQYGESAEGDDTSSQFSVTAGTSSSDGKGNVMFHLGYSDQGGVFSRDRDRSAVDQLANIYFDPENPSAIFEPNRPFFSSFPPQGRFDAGDTRYTYNANNQLQAGFSTNGNGTIGPDGFNRSNYRTIAIPTERFLFASKGHYELSDQHKFFFEGTYAATESDTELEPFPFASDDIYANGRVPVEFMVNDQLLRSAYIPDEIYNSATDTDGDGMKDIFFAKRLLDIGNRGYVAERDTFRFTLGMEGEIFNDWFYDFHYTYGKTKDNQVSGGLVNVQNFRYALESVMDSQDIDGDGITDEAICLDATARSFNCAPINIYGFNSIDAAAGAYVSAPSMRSASITQKIVGGNVSGELFELPAGYVAMAAGFEYREEESSAQFDALQQAGLNAGNAIPATFGEFDVLEFYAEFEVPILESLNFKGAVRSSDYSTVGGTMSWNAGFNWQPIDSLRFRVIQAQSTRAPNINELFSPPSQDFPSGLIDPCVGVTAGQSDALGQNCLANPGVAANVAANGSFTLNQSDIQGVSGFNRGNPELKEEVGTSTTVGMVFTPEFVEGLDITLDYFDIEIEDAIVSTPRQFMLDQCYASGNQEFCEFITRRPTAAGNNSAGSLEFIDTAVSNSGGRGTEGVDLTLIYSEELGPGQFRSRLAYTYLLDGWDIPLPGADKDEWAGEVGASEHKASLNLGYNVNDFDFTWRMTYIGSASLDDQWLAGFGFEKESVGIGAEVYHDLQASYYITESVEVFGGINNAFDNEPPAILTGVDGSDTGTETDAGTYDPIGRTFYLGFRAKF
ncbi:TonB-dependent receptor plug domain-containing protein [Pseudoalteromonas piratica]|uniref:TonB-dependent receptor n=1 Tax=Pseudoalteromonas piratica TaxID=1348114 RepID=A0A0A7EEG8_9GAMM|nr:TonB-dependent receptor [Pseudoalteromonas piratica]AIY64461.1 TonB-dependent receptor [Pseudoalteromonas piratica]